MDEAVCHARCRRPNGGFFLAAVPRAPALRALHCTKGIAKTSTWTASAVSKSILLPTLRCWFDVFSRIVVMHMLDSCFEMISSGSHELSVASATEVAAWSMQGATQTKITYEIVEHDGGWAYRVNGVFSEPFPTHDIRKLPLSLGKLC